MNGCTARYTVLQNTVSVIIHLLLHSICPNSTLKLLTRLFCFFLALLDYVSRAHEIEIRPSSVRRPSVASIISEVTA